MRFLPAQYMHIQGGECFCAFADFYFCKILSHFSARKQKHVRIWRRGASESGALHFILEEWLVAIEFFEGSENGRRNWWQKWCGILLAAEAKMCQL